MGVGTVDLHLGVPDTALTCTGWPDISVTVQAHDIDRACCRAQLLQVATGVTTIAVAIGATLPEGRLADGDSHPRSSGRAVPPVNHNRTPAELRAALARDTWGFPERQHIQREADSATSIMPPQQDRHQPTKEKNRRPPRRNQQATKQTLTPLPLNSDTSKRTRIPSKPTGGNGKRNTRTTTSWYTTRNS